MNKTRTIRMIIIIISIVKEDNVFSMTANLPYGPPLNMQTVFFPTFSVFDFNNLNLSVEFLCFLLFHIFLVFIH